MTFADYAKYSLTDFLEDDYFIQWATTGDERCDSFWRSFLQEYPVKETQVKEALSIIRVYRAQDVFSNDIRIDEVWKRIDASIGRHTIAPAARKVSLYAKIAAAILLLACATAVVWHLTDDHVVIVTSAYGEVRAVTLPDQSMVMLNGNSTLTYRDAWNASQPREVWVSGEAYFDVKHINRDTMVVEPGERFIVHGKGLDIEVLGTSFNVRSRRNKTNIALLTGKIEVSYADEASSGSGGLVMMPGDYVEYAGQKLLAKRKLSRPHKVATWTVREITFTDPLVGDIVESLQDNYGYGIRVEDKDLMELRIEGEISVTSVQELLAVVSSTLGIRIEESGKEIIIMRR